MSESRQGTKPADPQLHAGRPAQTLRPFGIPRWLGAGLYLLFSFVLFVPLVRRWRRERWWLFVRGALAVVGISLIACWFAGWQGAVAGVLGVMSLICGLWLGPLTDPDLERKLQRRHRAEYLLNGGVLVAGRLSGSEPLSSEQLLYLLIRSPHVMVVPKNGDGEVHAAIDIQRIERIEVGGELYVPTYVSEAKDPPVRETSVDQQAATEMTLTLDDGSRLAFRYQGAFHKHLAETAAHGIYSVRAGLRSGAPTPALQVINR
jgi:hypothetical protein